MRQIEYQFGGDFDRDFIEDELIEKYFIFDNPQDNLDQFIVYSETDEIFELSDYAKSYLLKEESFLINDDWKTKYKTAVRPFEYKDIFVRTPWLEPKEGAKNVIINPALAFGTGDHETTVLCSRNIIDYSGAKNQMFDAGTGTGILAYIAYQSGFKKAIGFDIDGLAIESAIENRELNGFSENDVELLTTTIDDPRFKKENFDLLVANMITTYLKMVIPTMIEMMDENSTMLLSGILATEEDMMKEYLSGFPVEVVGQDSLNEWILFIVKKR